MKKKIVVGMSGGVDSSMALLLLKQRGWDPVGVSLRLDFWHDPSNVRGENACCTEESLCLARDVCKQLDVPYYAVNVAKDFRKQVMDYFVRELKQGRTPNPCVMCNRYFKFKHLLEWGKKQGIRYAASGHYAGSRINPQTGKAELVRPKDVAKDQTYGLAFLTQQQLKRIVFPLERFTKQEVYALAQKEGFPQYVKKKQSQDLCFVSAKAYPLFLKKVLGENPGLIREASGKVRGKHRGLHFYTLGQKRGMHLPVKRYVAKKDVVNNELVVTPHPEAVVEKELFLKPFHFVSDELPKRKLRVEAKVRYTQNLHMATLYPPGKDGRLSIVFDHPVSFPTPGQFCVWYRGKVCLGGGVIC